MTVFSEVTLGTTRDLQSLSRNPRDARPTARQYDVEHDVEKSCFNWGWLIGP